MHQCQLTMPNQPLILRNACAMFLSLELRIRDNERTCGPEGGFR